MITGWGESCKVIFQVSIGVFRALSKNFSGKDGSAPPRKKLARMPMLYYTMTQLWMRVILCCEIWQWPVT